MGLQVMHRITAYSLLAVAALAVAVAQGRGRRAALAVLLVIVAQGVLGVSNVLLRLPVEVTLLHTAGAGAAVLVVTWFNVESWRSFAFSPASVAAPLAPSAVQMAEAK